MCIILTTGCVNDLDAKATIPDALDRLRKARGSSRDFHCESLPLKNVTNTVKLFINLDFLEPGNWDCLLQLIPKDSKFILSLGFDFTDEQPLPADQIAGIRHIFSILKPLVSEFGLADASAVRLHQVQAELGAEYPITIDNVHTTNCYVLPSKLLELSKEKDIKLLAHNDPKIVLDEKQMNHVSNIAGQPLDAWVFMLRIVSAYHDRQVLAGSEYILAVI